MAIAAKVADNKMYAGKESQEVRIALLERCFDEMGPRLETLDGKIDRLTDAVDKGFKSVDRRFHAIDLQMQAHSAATTDLQKAEESRKKRSGWAVKATITAAVGLLVVLFRARLGF